MYCPRLSEAKHFVLHQVRHKQEIFTMADKQRIDEKIALLQQTEEQWEMECLNDEDISIEMLDERVEFASLVPADTCILRIGHNKEAGSSF
jgi:hypothetical protein